jgi:hypothetical protein
MAGRPRKQRFIALRDRRLYLRFTEADYALLSRLGVLRGMCPGDTAYSIVSNFLMEQARWNPDLNVWWMKEIARIQAEEMSQ